ncbi:MAG: ABC transporter permease [Veillonella sp.]|uniref:ABC transporter permease n=1 Tax=Veillonella sp. TaxID=1926307 RepID=UPI0025FDF9F9|nr:ABC transporter permease [Veillonella sp.]MBS4913906.1 ABC transporter permease [Veillonella sp.]
MIYRIAWKQLWSKPLTTFLLLLVLATSIGLSVLVGTLGVGFQQGLTTATEPFTLLVGSTGSSQQLVMNTVFLQDRPLGNIPYAEVDKLRSQPKLVLAAVPLAMGDNVQGFRIIGTEPEIFTLRPKRNAPEWLRIDKGEQFKKPFEAVIGSAVAERTGLKVGDTFNSTHGNVSKGKAHAEHPFTVVGILDTTNGPYDQAVLTSIESIWDLHSSINKTGEHTDKKGAVTTILVEPMGYNQAYMLASTYSSRKDVQLVFPAQIIVQLFNLMGRGEQIWRPVGYLIISLSLIVMIVTIYLATMGRIKDYAILKTLGASSKQLYAILCSQSLTIILLGVVIGTIGGFSAYAAIANYVTSTSAIHVPSSITLIPYALLGIIILAGFLASLIPLYILQRRIDSLLSSMY